MSKILSMDLSLSCPAFAVLELDKDKINVLHLSHIKTKANRSHGERLMQIAQHLKDIFSEHNNFEAIVREKGFSHHARTTQALFKVVGVSDLALFSEGHDEIFELAPTTVKKIVTGDGKADKEKVMLHLVDYVGLISYKTNDESDAVAVGVAYLKEKGLI